MNDESAPATDPELPDRAGWYPDEDDSDRVRYFDGTRWTQRTRIGPESTQPTAPVSPWLLILLGVAVGGIGATLATAGPEDVASEAQLVGAIVWVLGGIVVAVGVIAAGVRLALAHHAWGEEQRLRPTE